MNVVPILPPASLALPVPAAAPVTKRRKRKLPKAEKAIAWGEPDRAWGQGVCASLERLSRGSGSAWAPAPRNEPFRVAIGWAAVAVVCLAVIAAGAAVNNARGSNERTYVSHVHL
jgi:hypothetical protein